MNISYYGTCILDNDEDSDMLKEIILLRDKEEHVENIFKELNNIKKERFTHEIKLLL